MQAPFSEDTAYELSNTVMVRLRLLMMSLAVLWHGHGLYSQLSLWCYISYTQI